MPPLYLIAQNIRSLYNVGSLFRTADAFQVAKIYLTGYTGEPPRDQITKVALGAETTVPWEKHYHTHQLIKKLRSQGIKIYCLETGPRTQNIYDFKPQFPCALVVGNEITGITPAILEFADTTISIPMLGTKTSLNVSISAGIALYELNRHRLNQNIKI